MKPSIVYTTNNLNVNKNFEFQPATESDIRKEIVTLNTSKAPTENDIYTIEQSKTPF